MALAPLALFWLVIGYFQHGQELRLNTRALSAQEEELRRQVEATTVLADNAQRQADATEGLVQLNKEQAARAALRELRDAQLDLVPRGGSSSGSKMTFEFQNRGGGVTDPELHYDGPHSLTLSPTGRLETNREDSFTLHQADRVPLEYPISFGLPTPIASESNVVSSSKSVRIAAFAPSPIPLLDLPEGVTRSHWSTC